MPGQTADDFSVSNSSPVVRKWVVPVSSFRQPGEIDIPANGNILVSSAGTIKELANKRVANKVSVRDQHHRRYCDN